MQRASSLIRRLRLSGDIISAEEMARAAWSDAVGKRIASNTRVAKLVRTRLVVEVEDSTWQRQLFSLSRHILANLEKALGAGLIDDLEFRVIPRRREPLMARASIPGATAQLDEADAIADPVLRDVYKVSRRKAQA
jgi:predicted nucleic acid-binding Zn ribbon protein